MPTACSPLRRTITREGAHGFFTFAMRPTCSSAYGRRVRDDSMRQTCFQSKFTARCGFTSIVIMFATGPPTRIMSSFAGPRALTSVSRRTTSPFGGAKSRPRKNPSSTAYGESRAVVLNGPWVYGEPTTMEPSKRPSRANSSRKEPTTPTCGSIGEETGLPRPFSTMAKASAVGARIRADAPRLASSRTTSRNPAASRRRTW